MKLEKLVGKKIVRTKPVQYENGVSDHSYTTTPLLLLKVTEHHMVVKSDILDNESLLGSRWMDDNWVDYDELINI
jgi:hypothetical protein